jgi:hypothetical protein
MSSLKATFKHGALLSAANWQTTLVQSVADSLFKLLIAVPTLGGVFFVALVIGSEPSGLLTLEWREMVTTIVTALLSQPRVLAAFLLALATVVLGGALFMFLVKAGTVSTLADGARAVSPVDYPPLHISALASASAFSVDAFMENSMRYFPRFARLGIALMAVYLLLAAALLGAGVSDRLTSPFLGNPAVLTIFFVVGITLVNLLYLLIQIVIVVDDCGVTAAAWRTLAFLRVDLRRVSQVFGVMLVLEILATGVSLLAIGALGLISFVPFLGLAALPVQLLAWLFRSVVFQYLALTGVATYLTLYRACGSPVVHATRRTWTDEASCERG